MEQEAGARAVVVVEKYAHRRHVARRRLRGRLDFDRKQPRAVVDHEVDLGAFRRSPVEDARRASRRTLPGEEVGRDDRFEMLAARLLLPAQKQREAGVRHDLIDAVFALGGEDDLVRLLARVKALQAFMATEDGANLLAGYKRAANILKQAGEVNGTAAGPPPTEADAALLAAIDVAEPAASAAVADERFTDAMAALASLRAPIDAFFDGVMVNDADEAVRAYRLGLLARFTGAVHGVADFSKIEG